MFNPTQVGIEAFVGELRTTYEQPIERCEIGFLARFAFENIYVSAWSGTQR